MDNLTNLQPNMPLLKEDLSLGILSCSISIEGVIKTYYFQQVQGGLICNDQLAIELRSAFEGAQIQEGHNGITTGLDSFIPTEIMDNSLIGIRQIGIDYLDDVYSAFTIEHIGIKGTRQVQSLLYYMLDEVHQEYKSSRRSLKFQISSEVISAAKQQGFYQHLTKFTETRGLKQEIVEGVEMGYIHEDRTALDIREIRANARVFDAPVSHEMTLAKLRLQGGIQEKLPKPEVETKVRKPFSFLPKLR
jgi:hypothetical protein